jgi:hypothetical protein
VLLVERVKVCAVVLPTRFDKHPDDDSENRDSSGIHLR